MIKNLNSGKGKLIIEKRHDVYQSRNKWPEFTRCIDCGALYVKGRWTGQTPPAQSHKTICSACRRIADHYPAGYVEIKGSFFAEHLAGRPYFRPGANNRGRGRSFQPM